MRDALANLKDVLLLSAADPEHAYILVVDAHYKNVHIYYGGDLFVSRKYAYGVSRWVERLLERATYLGQYRIWAALHGTRYMNIGRLYAVRITDAAKGVLEPSATPNGRDLLTPYSSDSRRLVVQSRYWHHFGDFADVLRALERTAYEEGALHMNEGKATLDLRLEGGRIASAGLSLPVVGKLTVILKCLWPCKKDNVKAVARLPFAILDS